MECNFRWKIYRQSESDNMHICLVSAEGAGVVGMTSKKIFRNQTDVVCTLHFYANKFVLNK